MWVESAVLSAPRRADFGATCAVTLLNVVVAVLLDEFVQAVSSEKEQVRAF